MGKKLHNKWDIIHNITFTIHLRLSTIEHKCAQDSHHCQSHFVEFIYNPMIISQVQNEIWQKNMYVNEEGRVYMHHNYMNQREFLSTIQNLHIISSCHNF